MWFGLTSTLTKETILHTWSSQSWETLAECTVSNQRILVYNTRLVSKILNWIWLPNLLSPWWLFLCVKRRVGVSNIMGKGMTKGATCWSEFEPQRPSHQPKQSREVPLMINMHIFCFHFSLAPEHTIEKVWPLTLFCGLTLPPSLNAVICRRASRASV